MLKLFKEKSNQQQLQQRAAKKMLNLINYNCLLKNLNVSSE